jgi:hypothetical protein
VSNALDNVATIARHPTVQLHFIRDTAVWHFARYYCAKQAQSETLLSLIDTIERYRCAPIAELVQEMAALYSVEVAV